MKKRKKYFSIKRLLNFQQSRISKIFQIFAGFSPFPLAVVIELVHRCNLNCEMCFQAANRKQFQKNSNEMEMDELKIVIDNIDSFRLIKPKIHLTGGEPLLHKSFLELISYLKEKKLSWSITTNGYLLEEKAEAIINCNCRQINLSLDGMEQIHNKIRGNRESFRKALAGVDKIIALRKKIKSKYPKITMSCVVSSRVYKNLDKLICFADQAGFDSLNFAYEVTFHSDKAMALSKNIDFDYLRKAVQTIKKGRHPVFVTFLPDIKPRDLEAYYLKKEHPFGNSCIFPWIICRVLPDGSVKLCHGTDKKKDLRKNTLKEIWNSKEFKEFREEIKKKGIPKQDSCLRCCKRQYYINEKKM